MSGSGRTNARSARGIGYTAGVFAIGLYQVALALLLTYLLFALWPERPTKDGPWSRAFAVLGWAGEIGDDARLILIVLCAGALGSYVHAATSFASYVGNRRLVLSWLWWYVLRPFIGMALALIFYFVVRGGLLATGSAASELSVFGVAAVAGLVGMFSKQATDKLRELFDNLFRTEQGHGDDARADKLGGNLPVSSAMIERRKMAAFLIPEGQPDSEIRMLDLYRMLGGVVTRVPVLDSNDVPRCVIHQSLIYKFLADQSISALRGAQPADGEAQPRDIQSLSLADFLAAPGMSELVVASLEFVPQGATLSEAKERMERTPNCQDVFVTEHGSRGEPALGWLTDAEVRRAAKF